jgi:DUF1009 family protein
MARPGNSQDSPLGIIAGGGTMPLAVAEAASEAGRTVHVVALEGWAEPTVATYPHSWVKIGQFGKVINTLEKHGCKDLVIVGSVQRTKLANVRLDRVALANLPTLIKLSTGGDNAVLNGILRFFETRGFRIIGAHEVASHLLAAAGPLGKRRPSAKDEADIAMGLKVVSALGGLDVGQAVVVAEEYVLAVEAAEGTDRMLERCASLKDFSLTKRRKTGGVLVKCAKPGQDQRVDLPAIGPETVRLAAEARLAGIAVSANSVLVAEREETVRQADRKKLFIVGVDAPARKPRSGR